MWTTLSTMGISSLASAYLRRLGSERGATAIEYAVVAAAIAAVVVLAVALLGNSTSDGFRCTHESFSTVSERC